jgi:hypothetical protein
MNAPKYILPKSAAELSKVQDKAIKAANNARNLIQIALVATIHHLTINHDVQVARRLVDGLHETVRGQAIVKYLAEFGHLNIGEMEIEVDGKVKTVTTFTSIKGNGDEHAAACRKSWEDCKATMWWTLKQSNPYKGFSLQEKLSAVLSQYQTALKRISEGKAGDDSLDTSVNDTTIKAILALCHFDAIAAPANGDNMKAAA